MSCGFLSFMAISKFPIPSLLNKIFSLPFRDEIPSICIISDLSFINSLTDILRFNSSIATKVSPKNGVLLTINNLSKVTVALGKFLNKLIFASANDTFASTFSLIADSILAFIWSLKKYGIAIKDPIINNNKTPTIFKIFLNIMIEI